MAVEIIPSLLVEDEKTFLRQIEGLGKSVTQVQIDIADGLFVPHITWADPAVAAKTLKMNCELHLMMQDPLGELKKWKNVPQVKRVLVHYESQPDISKLLMALKTYPWDRSLVLNPETPITVLEPFLKDIQGVMFMGVRPGRQGQSFLPETLEKIRAFKEKKTGHVIEIDGGVNAQTLPALVEAGVDAVCPGSAIFGIGSSPAEAVAHMKRQLAALTGTA